MRVPHTAWLIFTLSSAAAFADVTLDWNREKEWKINCLMDTWCKQGEPCVYQASDIKMTYLPQDGVAFRDLAGKKTEAIVLNDKGRPGSRARSFLFQLDQGATGLLTLFHSGGAVYSIQYEGSPAGGQMRFGNCSVNPVGEEVDL
ncbi:hypothetical protein [uncultured Roseobacter sp.]|uniref:hypothetical protein n=1 Tax=uncultured Roseobacter sp. TaxID=114847 RepID=UPI00262AF0C4|nr:hypothetical protein [uncultured Roseobacter sp.]